MLKFWLILLSVAGAVAMYFLSIAVGDLWVYSRLGPSTRAEVRQWHIIEKSAAAYTLRAEFAFQVGGKEYEGMTQFPKPYFLNIPSAESALKKLKTKEWHAWYNQKNPTICSLQKMFPFKSCIHAFMTLAVFVYFFFLRGFALRLAM